MIGPQGINRNQQDIRLVPDGNISTPPASDKDGKRQGRKKKGEESERLRYQCGSLHESCILPTNMAPANSTNAATKAAQDIIKVQTMIINAGKCLAVENRLLEKWSFNI